MLLLRGGLRAVNVRRPQAGQVIDVELPHVAAPRTFDRRLEPRLVVRQILQIVLSRGNDRCGDLADVAEEVGVEVLETKGDPEDGIRLDEAAGPMHPIRSELMRFGVLDVARPSVEL